MGEWNEKRSGWAREMIEAAPFFSEEEGSYTNIKDALCNIRHLCDEEGIEFADVSSGARMIYEGEVADDE